MAHSDATILKSLDSSARSRVLSMTHRNAIMLELWEGSSWFFCSLLEVSCCFHSHSEADWMLGTDVA